MLDVAGRVAVVTGGSSGLGRRFCIDLARRGAKVVAVARRGELLARVSEEMRAFSPDSTFAVCDVSDTAAFRDLLASLEDEGGRVDVLINNAGVFEGRPLVEQDVDHHRRIMEINYFSAVAGTLQVLPGMLERRFGVIVSTSSDSARSPGADNGAYSASKAALASFTESVAHAGREHGVHAHVLYPGWVPTAMGLAVSDGGEERMPPKIVRRTEEQVSTLLMKKMGGPSIEIAAAKAAVLAPLMRVLAPRLYRSQVAKQA